jgi:hypothetical protein
MEYILNVHYVAYIEFNSIIYYKITNFILILDILLKEIDYI